MRLMGLQVANKYSVASSYNSSGNGPPSDDGLSSVVDATRTGPFYTNEDIGILHTIASDAQEIRDNNTGNRKPKPIAALFKAYDDVLPQHGIDPDEDRHISAFLFKLGGEEGEGTFVEKLQIILGRMGIVLEFGEDDEEDDVVSVRRPASPGPSEVPSMRSQQPIIHRSPMQPAGRPAAGRYFGRRPEEQPHNPNSYFGRDNEQPNEPSFYFRRPNEQPKEPSSYFGRPNEQPSKFENFRRPVEDPNAYENFGRRSEEVPYIYDDSERDYDDDEDVDDDYEDLEEPQADPETEQAMQIARRVALSSALNKWRTAAAKAQRNQGAATLAASMNRLSLGNQRPGPSTITGLQGPQATSQASTFGQREPAAQPTAPARPLDRPSSFTGPSQAHLDPTSQRNAPKVSFLPMLDRWRAAALQGRDEQQRLSPVEERTLETTTRVLSPASKKEQKQASSSRSPDATTRVAHPAGKGEQKPLSLSPQQDRILRAARTTSLREALENRVNAKQAHQREVAQNGSSSSAATSPQQPLKGALRPAQIPETQIPLRIQEEREVQRAARAREIFLASRVFNHWADKTARRLEREAVARRHMIRFRCFRGWSEIPTSRAPAVDRLRVVTAAQKLKRACLENEEQLRVTAAAAAQSYRLKKLNAALDRWYYHLAENVSQERLAHRTRLKTVTKWFFRAEDDEDLGYAVTNHRRKAEGVNALIRWQGAAEIGSTRDEAASQLGGRHLAWKYLRDWWDQAEAGRRSRDYRQQSLAEKASHAFDIWNLQARAQAFVWHTQYRTVSRIFDFWLERSQEDAHRQREARRMHEHALKARCVNGMRQYHQQQAVLKRQADRANLYIKSHRLLAVFGEASARREEQDRQQVRQYLMRRYEEVSRARKKRNFFYALDCWRASAAEARERSIEAERLRRTQDGRRVLAAVESWSVQAEQAQQVDQRAQSVALRGRFFQTLNTWTEAAADHEHNQHAAQQHDADRKKRQVQKVWANSTLQHGSNAHTAAALKQRYDRDKRNKVFNVLLRRQTNDTNPHIDTELASRTRRLNLGSSSRTRNKSQENTSRRLLFGASQATQGTPSRPPTAKQTPTPRGRRVDFAASMASTKRPTPIREEGEGSRVISDEAEEVHVKSPVKPPRGLGSMMAFPKLSSTTPKGPIPAHVEGDLAPRRSQLPAGGPSQSFGNLYQSGRQDRASTTPFFGMDNGFSSRSTSGLPDRSTSNTPATSRSTGPRPRTLGTGRQSAPGPSQQPSRLSQRPLFGSSTEPRGTYRPQLPDRLFPSPERRQEDDDLWDHLEDPDWDEEELE